MDFSIRRGEHGFQRSIARFTSDNKQQLCCKPYIQYCTIFLVYALDFRMIPFCLGILPEVVFVAVREYEYSEYALRLYE